MFPLSRRLSFFLSNWAWSFLLKITLVFFLLLNSDDNQMIDTEDSKEKRTSDEMVRSHNKYRNMSLKNIISLAITPPSNTVSLLCLYCI